MPDTMNLPGIESETQDDTETSRNAYLYPQPALPGLRPEETLEAQRIDRGIQEARTRVGSADEAPFEYVVRRAIPFVSTFQQYQENAIGGESLMRVRAGSQNPDDFRAVAQSERYRNLDQQRTTGQAIASGLTSAAGFGGEIALSGGALRAAGAIPEGASLLSRAGLQSTAAITAATPASYAPRWAQNNIEAGRSANDFRGLPGSLALGFAQNAVLGSLGGVANQIGGTGVGPVASRLFARTAIGMAEQQGVDLAASAADHVGQQVFGASLGMDTHYGLLGHLYRGEGNDAMREGATQALTFAIFAGLHEAQHGTPRRGSGREMVWAPSDPAGLPPESPLARQRVEVRGVQTNPAPVETPPSRRLAGPAIMEETRSYLNEMGRQGLSPEAAGENLRTVTRAIGSLLTHAEREGTTREAARKAIMDQFPPGPARDYAIGLIEKLSGFSEVPSRSQPPRQAPEVTPIPPVAEQRPATTPNERPLTPNEPSPGASEVSSPVPSRPQMAETPIAAAPIEPDQAQGSISEAVPVQAEPPPTPAPPPQTEPPSLGNETAAAMDALRRVGVPSEKASRLIQGVIEGRVDPQRAIASAPNSKVAVALRKLADVTQARQATQVRDALRPFEGKVGDLPSDEIAMTRMQYESWKDQAGNNIFRLIGSRASALLAERSQFPGQPGIDAELGKMAWMWDRAERELKGATAETATKFKERLDKIERAERYKGVPWATWLVHAVRATFDLKASAGNDHQVWYHIREGKYQGERLNQALAILQADYGTVTLPQLHELLKHLREPTTFVTGDVAKNAMAARRQTSSILRREKPPAKKPLGAKAAPAAPLPVPPSTSGQIATPEASKPVAVAKTGVPGALPELWKRHFAGEAGAREQINAQAGLSERQAAVLWGRMPIDQGGDGRTLEAIAKDQGVTRERIRQIEQQAREKAKFEVSVHEFKEQVAGLGREGSGVARQKEAGSQIEPTRGQESGPPEGFQTQSTPEDPEDIANSMYVALMEEAKASGRPLTPVQEKGVQAAYIDLMKRIENGRSKAQRSGFTPQAIERALRAGLEAGENAKAHGVSRDPNSRAASRKASQAERSSKAAQGGVQADTEALSVGRAGIIGEAMTEAENPKWHNLLGIFRQEAMPAFVAKLDKLTFNELRSEARAAGIDVTGVLNRSHVMTQIEAHVNEAWHTAEADRYGVEEVEGDLFLHAGPDGRPHPQPLSPANIKAVADISPHHATLVTKLQGMVRAANIPVELKVQYMRTQLAVLARMTPDYADLHNKGLREAKFYGTVKELTASIADSPPVKEAMAQGKYALGSYNRGTGVMRLDGGTAKDSAARTAGHESAHSAEGKEEAVARSPGWQKAWAKEIQGGAIGEYATTNVHEGLAEVMGLVLSGEISTEALHARFPLVAAELEGHGWIPDRSGEAGFTKPADVFDEAINDGPLHVDTLLRPDEALHLSPQESIKRFLAEESGHLDMDVVRDAAEQYGATALRAIQHIRHSVAELAGEMGPRTTKLNRAAGEALARFNVADTYARFAAPVLTDKVLGDNTSLEFRRQLGGVLTERRLRFMKQYYTNVDAGIANRVKSIIGQPNSPFKTLADYKKAFADPNITEAIKRYEQYVAPVMEEAFRRSQGMEADDPINSPTQIPGSPINLKATRKGEETPNTVRTKEGNLRNEKLHKNKFANQAFGDAEGYDIDIANIIEHSLTHQLTNAAKAEAVQVMVDQGVARWGKPGESHEFANVMKGGSPYATRFEMKPPPGTQASLAGQTVLSVHPQAADEFRRALRVDQKLDFKTINAVMRVLTTATLASTAEITYHTKNQLSFLMKPGVRPWEFFKTYRDVVMKKPEIMDRLVELARIGTMKEHGLEGGIMGGKYNPLTYGGKFLDLTRKVLALMGDDAYDRLVDAGLAHDTQTGRRNFINQLGQYNKYAAHKAVKLLRDTQIGPFATAGVNAPMQAVRAVFGGHGAEATSAKADLQLRAATMAKYIGVLATVAIINNAIWGTVTGSDDTPLGALRVGTSPDGRARYIDILDLIGLKRGLRVMGLLAVTDGGRQNRTRAEIADKAAKDVVNAVIHPAAGPGVQFGLTSAFGVDARGFKAVERAQPGQSQTALNMQAAAMHANPLVHTMFGHENKNRPPFEKAMELLGPFGIRSAPPRR